jgi:hypothetical protein
MARALHLHVDQTLFNLHIDLVTPYINNRWEQVDQGKDILPLLGTPSSQLAIMFILNSIKIHLFSSLYTYKDKRTDVHNRFFSL